jgi:hypothetical protein
MRWAADEAKTGNVYKIADRRAEAKIPLGKVTA